MRHRKGNKHLNRTSAHARSMVANTIVNLLKAERIRTTLKKAKLVRPYAEKMITLGRKGTLHARRRAMAFLRSKPAVAKLFGRIGPRFADRNGGYTRILRLAATIRPATSDRIGDFEPPMGSRLGDGTDMAILELVEGEVTPREKQHRSAPKPFKPRRDILSEQREGEQAEAVEPAATEPETAPQDSAPTEAPVETPAEDDAGEAPDATEPSETPDAPEASDAGDPAEA